MDGNYTRCLPQRLARATGLILLDTPTAVSLIRYVRRCWFERERHGSLDGGRDSVKWAMVRHIAGPTRRNRGHYGAIFDEVALPKVRLSTATGRAVAMIRRAADPPGAGFRPASVPDELRVSLCRLPESRLQLLHRHGSGPVRAKLPDGVPAFPCYLSSQKIVEE